MLTSLGIGGAEKQVLELAERMAARGHAVTLIVLRAPELNQWPTGLPVHYLYMQRSPVEITAALIRARRILKAFQPHFLHSHTFPANMVARTLRLIGATPKVLSTIHNVYEGGSIRMAMYRLTDPLSVHTTAVSSAAAERFIRLQAVPARKCTVLTNAIDLAQFNHIAERRHFMRGQIKNAENFIWLAIGRIVPAKDYPNLLQAFARILTVEPSASLWIAGELPAGTSPEDLFKEASSPSAVRERCTFLGVRRDIPDLLDAADGYVLSSAWEGMPLVVGEAMSMEKRVVVTNVGGVRELVGDCGTIVPPNDSESLSEAMLHSMKLPACDVVARGQAARERIAKHFSWDTRVNSWEQLYKDLLAPEVQLSVEQSA